MKILSLKFAAFLLALVAGIGSVWVIGILQLVTPSSTDLSEPFIEIAARQHPPKGKSGQVLVDFKDFEYGKGWVANFEVINETTRPIFYVGRNDRYKFDYCTLAVRHIEKVENLAFKIRDLCYFGTNLTLQKLEPGENVILAVDEYEVRSLRHINDAKLATTAQVGFEVFVGDEKRREISWSQEITFPYDEYR